METRANNYRIGEQSFQGEERAHRHNGTTPGGVGQGEVWGSPRRSECHDGFYVESGCEGQGPDRQDGQ